MTELKGIPGAGNPDEDIDFAYRKFVSIPSAASERPSVSSADDWTSHPEPAAAGRTRMNTGAMVAVLFADPAGVYSGLPDVDLWDEARDARLYDGPWPVVAHPPCKSWSLMGNCRPLTVAAGDGGTFTAALAAVEKYGGVLEHPAHTRAWRTFNLPKPAVHGWNIALLGRPGWATEIDQAAYGHSCHKLTWLYYVGPKPPALDWRTVLTGRKVSDDGGGGRDQRSKTPPEFRDVLLAMARGARVESVA